MKIIIVKKRKWRVVQGEKNRVAGERLEMKVLRRMRPQSLLRNSACRSMGSRSLFDIWMLQGDKLRLIICRTNGYLLHTERDTLKEFLRSKPPFVQVELEHYSSPKVLCRHVIKSEEHVRTYYK